MIAKPTHPPSDAAAQHASAWGLLWAQVAAHMQALGAHSARTVVLLPFFQLQNVARQTAQLHWTALGKNGFLPRIETTKSWSQRVYHFTPGALDISFDAGLDSLRAAQWLQRAGLQAQQTMLVGALVRTAHQLGVLVAAVPPEQRADWADAARINALYGLDKLASNPLMYEAAVARIALEWAVASRYESDVLFDSALHSSLDALIVMPGLQPNPLANALAQHWHAISAVASWSHSQSAAAVTLHTEASAHDEAERAAACVLAHIAAGRVPVALAAVDRVATRRICATLALHGALVQDETGWKLSTTRAAASVMALLRAARRRVQQPEVTDAQIDWLKHTNAPVASVNHLEQHLRRKNSQFPDVNIKEYAINFIVNEAEPAWSMQALLGNLHSSRSMVDWLTSLQVVLRATGQWGALVADAAGRDCLQALHLLQPELLGDYNQPISLAGLTAWASDCLENASFKPSAPDAASAAPPQVIVLPLAQVLARPFTAIVIASADEQRLPASPEPVGHWSQAQRAALGLPTRAELATQLRQVWDSALRLPQVDVLWRSMDADQALQPSPLLQRWLLTHQASAAQDAIDPRVIRSVQAAPTAPPQPSLKSAGVAGAPALRVSSLSASSYSDLRACPYRFFALRLLGLHNAPELDTELNKGDFGSWLHSVLADFHVRRKSAESTATVDGVSAQNTSISVPQDVENDVLLLDQCAAEHSMLDVGFVPYAAAWPQLRDSYLQWLAQHTSEGWQFDQAEFDRTLQHGEIQLKGRLDRVDRLSRGPEAGTAYVIDYKTESSQASKAKTKIAAEDTQLAFYAALLGEDDLHAAYVNLAERTCATTAQDNIMTARDKVLHGITLDVGRIHAGHAMPALGEGKACDYCDARGLCRKDLWTL